MMDKTKTDVSMWIDETGDNILIGNEYGDEGDPVISIPFDTDNVLEWIKVLLRLLDDNDIYDVPGTIGTFGTSEDK